MGLQERQKREKEIINAAVKLFATKGYGSTKMVDIAQEVQLSVGNLYFYFKNKDELYISVILEASRRNITAIDNGLEHSAKDATGLDKILSVMEYYLDTMHSDLPFQEIFSSYISRVISMSRSQQYKGITERMKASKDFEELQRLQWTPATKLIVLIQEGKEDGSIGCKDSSLLIFTNIWAFSIGSDILFFPELKEGIPQFGIPKLDLDAWKKSNINMVKRYLQSN